MPSQNSLDKAHQAQTQKELFLYQTMVNSSLESIALIDKNYTYRIVNDAYVRSRNLKKDEILNQSVADVWEGEVYERVIKDKLDACFNGDIVSHVSAYEFEKDEINYIETIYTPCYTSGPEVSYAVVVSHNITELKQSQERVKTLAYYDALTNLPSRPLFMDLLNHEIKRSKRNGKTMAVLFLDLDEFKRINDTFGHSAGDELLVSVGDRLKKCFRQSDTIGRPGGVIRVSESDSYEHVARLGGDEFTLITPNVADKKFVTGIAEKLLDLFKDPFQIADREIFISTSIGIALYPENGDNVETLLKNADTAMYKAKAVGKNTYRYYSPEMNAQAVERIKLENRMRYAIKNNEYLLYYQPQYEIESHRLIGMEALLRWNNKEMGLVSPADFIPLAEETGMIIPIGEWVVHSACSQGKIWHDMGYKDLHISANLSMRQFFDPYLATKIKSIIDATQFDRNYLELEITETSMMHDTDRAIQILNELKEMGIKISLDDFGTGYSSLIYLKHFHTDTLKIDQTFVRNADLKGRDGAIISSIIEMCHKLQITVVAEGVETEENLDFLKSKNCHVAQGYFFSPPLPVGEAQALLAEK